MATYLRAAAVGGFFSGTWSGERAQCTWTFIVGDEDPRTTPLVNQDIAEFSYDDSSGSGSWDHGNFDRGFGGDALTEAVQKSLANAVWGWMDGVKSFQSNSFQWAQAIFTLQQYDEVPPGGWGQKFAQSSFNLTPKITGTGATTMMPPQLASCVSHYTDGSGGRNRGRIFVPIHPAGALGTNGLLASATIDGLMAAEDTFFDAVAAISVGGGTQYLTPTVVSLMHRTYSTITEVRCGDEMDTQRRRRNFRSETYTTSAWPTA